MSDVPSARSRHLTILIADIVSSTALYESLGDSAAKRMVAACLDILRQATEAHGGRVVKHLGDGMLCAFEHEQSAVQAALEMCRRNGEEGLAIRVGINSGQVLEDDGDVFGDAVNTASRISSLAKPMEILISGELERGLPDGLQSLARRVPPLTVKGKKQPLRLYAILADSTASREGPAETLCLSQTLTIMGERSSAGRLELCFLDRTILLSSEEELTIGRDTDCGLAVPSRHASRLHARIFGRRGRFVLADQSSNGTFLVPGRRSKLHLIREEAILYGSGNVYVGEDPATNEVEPIRYRIL
jgi:adenylate cyclase